MQYTVQCSALFQCSVVQYTVEYSTVQRRLVFDSVQLGAGPAQEQSVQKLPEAKIGLWRPIVLF